MRKGSIGEDIGRVIGEGGSRCYSFENTGGSMSNLDILQGMTLEQIRSVIEVLQQSSDSYLFILDLNTDVYMVSERATKRFPFEDTVMEDSHAGSGY